MYSSGPYISVKAGDIAALLEHEQFWLYQGEIALLRSFLRQAEEGRTLSDKQTQTFRKIAARVEGRHRPRFLPG